MSNAFVDKLRSYSALGSEDVAMLLAATSAPREIAARQDLIREGDRPGPVFVMLDGWACRYNITPEGRRQITAFLMPGDCCDLHASVLAEMDHSIATISAARVCFIPRDRMEEMIDKRPAITRALRLTQLVDEGTLRAWIVSMGRRSSVQRVAHLMCELYVRARSVGLTSDRTLELPLTQIVLGDALGLTPVHVNRVLARLREDHVMELRGGSLIIADAVKLALIAGFDDAYLHRRLQRAA